MKSKKSFSFLLVVLLCIMSVGCSNKNYNKENNDTSDLYTSTKNDDNTYSYSFSDLSGNILFEKENVVREPEINRISANVYELITRAGTGLSTNWAVYCNVENSKTSEIYYYVLAAKENYVIRADYKDGKHFIIVQNIFDKSAYYKTYEIENVSPVKADFIVACKFNDDGNATVTYIAGENYTETQITITIP